MKKKLSRDQQIIRTSVIGILTNTFLSIFKLIIGLLSSSIAIMMDAINNLSDALSSIITIIGMKLALKPADNKHPLGHGRIEYLSAMIVSSIVFFAGATSLIESVKKIINPTTSTYTPIMLAFIIVAIAAKLVLGKYTKRVGESVNSNALIASGSDATFDAIVSASTLLSALVSIIWKLNIDGIVGVAISLVIIKAAWDMLSDTLDRILGSRIDSSLSKEIKAKIKEEDLVIGVYDLILHNYGPETMIGFCVCHACLITRWCNPTACTQRYWKDVVIIASQEQVRYCEVACEGSWRRGLEPTYRNLFRLDIWIRLHRELKSMLRVY